MSGVDRAPTTFIVLKVDPRKGLYSLVGYAPSEAKARSAAKAGASCNPGYLFRVARVVADYKSEAVVVTEFGYDL